MPHFALSVVGRDRPGIAAAVTEPLAGHAVNIEDSRMTILRGHFTMMLILAAPGDVDRARLAADLDAAGGRLGLEAVVLRDVDALDPHAAPATHIATVYGADHPGIVHAVTGALSAGGVNITDLSTRLVGDDEGEPLYVMMLELAPPAGTGTEALQTVLAEVGSAQGVDVSIGELESDVL